MPEYTVPSRAGLLVGAALVALHGLQQESILQARHWGYDDWNKHETYAECKRLIAALRRYEPVTTTFKSVMDLMAHTCQTLRVSVEEWEASVPLTLTEKD
jgi:hypothetical protein